MISLKFVPKGAVNNVSQLVQIMAWRRSGHKPLFEPMIVSLLKHICVSRPQWIKPVFHRVQPNEKFVLEFTLIMMTSSNGNIFCVTGHLCVEYTGPGEFPAQRPVMRSFDVSLICVWINGWVNHRKAGDLRRYRAHYDVIVMLSPHSKRFRRDSNATVFIFCWKKMKNIFIFLWNEIKYFYWMVWTRHCLSPGVLLNVVLESVCILENKS